MPLKLGAASASLRRGSASPVFRVGKDGAWGAPGSPAILSVSTVTTTDTIVHAIPESFGLEVTYTYYRQQGISLPVPVTPASATSDKQYRTVAVSNGGLASGYSWLVVASTSAGDGSSLISMPGVTAYPQAWPSDSFPAHLQNQIGGLSPTEKQAAYVNDVRNASAWFASIDLSSVPTTAKGGVLISPEHAIFTAHYAPSVGNTVTWIAPGGESVSRTITALATHPGYNSATYANDIAVARLSAPVTTISPAKTLPGDIRAYIPSISGVIGLLAPTLSFEFGSGGVQEVASPLLEITAYSGFGVNYVYRTAALRPSIVSGDSGQPLFVVVNGEAVLVGLWTGSFYGTLLADEIPEINAMMADLGGGYELQAVDLSGFAELLPAAPTVEWYEAPSNGQLLVYIYNPQYPGTSPITGVQVYVDDVLLPDGTFTATTQPYGPNAWTALISGPQGAFTGIEIKAAVVSAVGVGPISEPGTDLS